MVALPDFDREFSAPPFPAERPEARTDGEDHDLRRGALRLVGVAVAAAAPGLWVLPTVAADPAMMLMKMVFSLGLFWAGLLCLHAARRPDPRPEVQIDRRKGLLHVIHPAQGRAPERAVVHRIDDLQELSLRGGMLRARDCSGQLLFSLELGNRRTERDLRRALSLAG
jgi:hypothetical protein